MRINNSLSDMPSFRRKRSWRVPAIIGFICLILVGIFFVFRNSNKTTTQDKAQQQATQHATNSENTPSDSSQSNQSDTSQSNSSDTSSSSSSSSSVSSADVSVAPLKESKTFDVMVGEDKVGTITRSDLSQVVSVVTRDTHAYIGFAKQGIGGAYYTGPDEVWKIDPQGKTMSKIELSNVLINAISSDEQKIAYRTLDKPQELHVRNLSTGKEKLFSVDGYDAVGDALFSPNSDKIAIQLYNTTVADKHPTAVYFYNFTTGSQVKIAEKDTIMYLKQWNSNSEIEYSSRFVSMNDF